MGGFPYTTRQNWTLTYKAEAMPHGESIQDFCLKNKVPYNLFHKWYKDTRHQIIPVQVEGQPNAEADTRKETSSSPLQQRLEDTEPQPVKIMIDIYNKIAIIPI